MYRKRVRILCQLGAATLVTLVAAGTAYAALQGNEFSFRNQVLIGRDDDDQGNPIIQNNAGGDQSLRRGDQLLGGYGRDLLIGRLGPDTLISGRNDIRDRDDVMVGGLEAGTGGQFAPTDIAKGGQGDDAFLWAPGDGSDALIGGERDRFVQVKRRVTVRGRRVVRTVRVRTKADRDTLVIGVMATDPGDQSRPELFNTRYGRLPRIFVDNRNKPAQIGTPPRASTASSCTVVRPPAGLGYNFLVRVFVANGPQAVTIRIKNVEELLCGSASPNEGIVRTTFGPRGDGPVVVRSRNFQPRQGSKLAAFVR
jgi:hypothetical protein